MNTNTVREIMEAAWKGGKFKPSASLKKKQDAAFIELRDTIADLAEKQGYPRSLAKDVTKDKFGVIEYPDDLIDTLAEGGKGDIGKKIADVNVETFDTVKDDKGVGLGTVYRDMWENEPGLGDPNMAKHGTGANEIFTEFDVDTKLRPFYNDTPDPAVADAFSGMNDLKRQISNENMMGTDYVQQSYENAKNPTHEASRIKPRTIPLQSASLKPWNFHNPSHVDEIVNNLPDVDIKNPDVILGLNYEDLDDLRNGVISAENNVMITDRFGDAVLKDREQLKAQIADGDWGLIENKEVGESAQQLGYDSGTVIEEMLSRQDASTPENFKTVNKLTYDPRNAKLPWAFKDPAKLNSKDMMGSADSKLLNKVAATAVGGAVAAPLLFGSEDAESMELLPKAIKAAKRGTFREAAHLGKTETPSELTRMMNEEGIHAEQSLAQDKPNLAATQQRDDFGSRRMRRGQSSRGQMARGERIRDKRAKDTLRELGGEEALAQYTSLTGEAKRIAQAAALEYYDEMNPSMFARMREQFTGTQRMDAHTPEDRALIENTPEFHYGRAGGAAYDPENKITAVNEAALQIGLATTWGDEGRKNIISNQIPNAKFRSVGEGDAKVDFVTLPDGKEFIINKPGFSETDFTLLAAELAAYAPLLGWTGRGAGLANKMIRGAGVGMGTDATLQGAGILSGNEQDYSPEQTAIVTATGGGGELIRPAVKLGGKYLANKAESNIPSARELGKLKKQWQGLGDLEMPLE